MIGSPENYGKCFSKILLCSIFNCSLILAKNQKAKMICLDFWKNSKMMNNFSKKTFRI